jgi:hypothetical protein
MSLSQAFPQNVAIASILRNLVPGSVIKLIAEMDDGKEHEKRFVVLYVDETTFCCVINSKINPFIAKRKELLQCQVKIEVGNHPFMSWDSHIDCHRVLRYKTADVCKQLSENADWLLGQITQDLTDEVISALKYSRFESPILIKMCCDSLGASKSGIR